MSADPPVMKARSARERRELLKALRAEYEAAFPDKQSRGFTGYDWARCAAAYEALLGTSVLVVGVGAGQMFGILARDYHIKRLCGVDTRWHARFVRPPWGELELMSATDLRFADREFDTVLCMEVLEHLEFADFPTALAELRRVYGRRLIVTIPFEEPEPVWHHDRPGGHRQSFSRRLIDVQFANAKRRLLSRGKGKWPWIMLQETRAPAGK